MREGKKEVLSEMDRTKDGARAEGSNSLTPSLGLEKGVGSEFRKRRKKEVLSEKDRTRRWSE